MKVKKYISVISFVLMLMISKKVYANNLTVYKEKQKILNNYEFINERKIFNKSRLIAKKTESKKVLKVGNPILKTSMIIKDKPSKYEAKFTLNSNLYTINGKIKSNKGEPINLNGNVFIPIRTIAEMLNIDPEYNKKDKTVFLSHNNFDALFSLETGKIAIINNKNQNDIKVLDSLVVLHQEENYIPITALKEIGFNVETSYLDDMIKVSYD